MEWQTGIVLMVALLIARLAIPLGITFGLAYFLRRIDTRWQAELEAPPIELAVAY